MTNKLRSSSTPRLGKVVERTRLFSVLDQHMSQAPVTWICAPPGAGKTTLVASYLKKAGKNKQLWYALDHRDADAATFLFKFNAYVEEFSARGKNLPTLTPESFLGDMQLFARDYFSNAFGLLRGKFYLVFDNFQDVPESNLFQCIILEALQQLPESSHAVIISRSEPPNYLVGLRAKGWIRMVSWDQIKLDREETAAVVANSLPGQVEAQLVDALHKKTHGWVTGLKLFLEQAAMGSSDDVPVADFDPGVIFDYFAGEIFQRLSNERRTVLLKTAYLPRFTADLAAKLAAMPSTQAVMVELQKRNFFLSKDNRATPFYEYHPLFRRFLQDHIEKTCTREESVQLKRDSARLLAAEGMPEYACELYCSIGDWEPALTIILQQAPDLARRGQIKTIADWLQKVPPPLMQEVPWLLYWQGICLMALDADASRLHFERAYALFESRKDFQGMLMACAGVMDAILYQLATPKLLDPWIPRAEQFIANMGELPQDVTLRIIGSLFLALLIRQPQHVDAERWAEKVLDASRQSKDVNLRITNDTHVAFYYLFRGLMAKAFAIIEDNKKWLNEHITPLAATTLKSAEAMYHLLMADDDACEQAVGDGVAIMEKSGVYVWWFQLMSHGVGCALSAGRWQTARQRLKHMASAGYAEQRLSVCYHHYMAAWSAWLHGEKATARQHAETSFTMADELGMPFMQVLSHHAMAKLDWQRQSTRAAEAHLDAAQQTAEAFKSPGLRFLCLLTRAHFRFMEGMHEQAVEHMSGALRLGKQHNIVNTYWWDQAMMADICVASLQHGIETEYVSELIGRRGIVPAKPPVALENWPWPIRIYTLGRFELVVNGKPVRPRGRGPTKNVDLLKFIIAEGGRDISDMRITDHFWQDEDGDKAASNLKMTLMRLREVLQNKEAIVHQSKRIRLNDHYCWVDIWALERSLGEAEHHVQQADWPGAWVAIQKAADLYRGEFLHGDADELWAMHKSRQLKKRFLNLLETLSVQFQPDHDARMEDLYRLATRIDPCAEKFYEAGLRYLLANHQFASAAQLYQECRMQLEKNLNLRPSPAIEELYQQIAARGAGG